MPSTGTMCFRPKFYLQVQPELLVRGRPDPAVLRALAVEWKRTQTVTKEWQEWKHDLQHLLALDAVDYFDALLYTGTEAREDEVHQYEIGVYRAATPHPEYWFVDPRTRSVKIGTHWFLRNSPYLLLPKFGLTRRALLIAHLLICLCYSRLETRSIMANITPIIAHDVPTHIRGAKTALNFVLNITEAMFRHRKTLNDSAYDKAMASTKKILRKSLAEPETR